MEGVHRGRIIADKEAAESLEKFCRDYGIDWNLLPPRDRLICIQMVMENERSNRTHKSNEEFKQAVMKIFKQINERDAKSLKAQQEELDRLIKKVKDGLE